MLQQIERFGTVDVQILRPVVAIALDPLRRQKRKTEFSAGFGNDPFQIACEFFSIFDDSLVHFFGAVFNQTIFFGSTGGVSTVPK